MSISVKEVEVRLQQLQNKKMILEKTISRELEIVYEAIKDPATYIRTNVAQLATDKGFISDLMTILVHFLARKFSATKEETSPDNFFGNLFSKGEKSDGHKKTILQDLINYILKKNDKDPKNDH